MNRTTLKSILACVLTFAATASLAHEPPPGLLVHMPFDGSADVRGRVAPGTEVVTSDGSPGSLSYDGGYMGQAAVFNGENAIRIPIDLNPDLYPQLTVTMWINAQADQQTGYLFSNGAPGGPKLQYTKANMIAHATRTLARVPNMVRTDRWAFVAGVWDHSAGKLRMYVDRRVEEVDLDAAAGRRDSRAEPESWIGTYNAKLQSTVRGVLIDEVRIYGRALSADELLGLALGPPIEEKPRQTGPFVIPKDEEEPQLIEPPQEDEPQLIEPPLPPEEGGEPHRAPDGVDTEPDPHDPRSGMHRDRSGSEKTGARPGEDPALDKLRRTQVPGGHRSDDAVSDAIGDDYEPGPTTDWEQVQEEARNPDVSEEELDRLRRSEAGTVNPGGDRASDAVRDQLGNDDIPESTDFETRRQGLDQDSDSVSGQGRPAVAGNVDITPAKDGELYVRVKPGAAVATPWSSSISPGGADSSHSITLDLEDNAIHTIEWFERRDRPCKIVVYGYAPGTNQFGGANVESFGRDVCRSAANERSRKRVTIVGDGAAITDMRVGDATSTGNYYTVKGLEIRGLVANADGTLSKDGAYDKATRANCCGLNLGPSHWGGWLSCPAGHVATGIKALYHEDNVSRPQIHNLALLCREVDD